MEKTDYTYRDVKSVEGLKVTSDGRFLYRGREKKVTYPYTVRGTKATARVQIMIKCVHHYYQAAKLVAEAWKASYEEGDYITYKDGDIHNICADNLNQFVKWEDILEKARVHADYNARHSDEIIEKKCSTIKRLKWELGVSLGLLLLTLLKMAIW